MKVQISALGFQHATACKGTNYHKKNIEIQSSHSVQGSGAVVQISFKRADKNLGQLLSVAAEDGGLGLSSYNFGGVGCVTQEAPAAMKKYGMDARIALPYHTIGNEDIQGTGQGKITVATLYDAAGAELANDKKKFELKTLDYRLQPGERFVIQAESQNGVPKYRELVNTGISGTIKRFRDSNLDVKEVPYHVFEVLKKSDGEPTRYIFHLPDVARMPEAYAEFAGVPKKIETNDKIRVTNYTQHVKNNRAYAGTIATDTAYTEFNRAVVDALPKLKNGKQNFNPASIWLHCRQSFCTIPEFIDRSRGDKGEYYRGVRIHTTLHNPGMAYQGRTDDPFAFIRQVASSTDIDEIMRHPEYEKLRELAVKTADNDYLRSGATEADKKLIREILHPYIGRLIDETGEYNLTKVPVEATNSNPYHFSYGTVSRNYGLEMRNSNYDIALGLSKYFATVKSYDITNGCTPESMELNSSEANFGRAGNGLNKPEIKIQYKPFAADIKGNAVANLNEVLGAKEANTKWLVDLIGSATEEIKSDAAALQKLFFNTEQIASGQTVLGGFSKFQEGDKLVMGWGRPDPQKGLSVTLEAFYKFLTSDVPDAIKAHTKLLLGAGPNAWNPNERDWDLIQKIMGKISDLNGGAYKGNVVYVNGLVPKRLVACAHSTIFSSRYEPCGITPIESLIGGAPVISIKTGGAPDLISHLSEHAKEVGTATGILTDNPFLITVQDLEFLPDDFKGLKDLTVRTAEELKKITPSDLKKYTKKQIEEYDNIIDTARIRASSDELAICIKRMASIMSDKAKPEIFAKMVENAFLEKVDWHENCRANGTPIPAVLRYLNEVWGINEQNLERLPGRRVSATPLERFKIERANTTPVQQVITNIVKAAEKNKIATAALGGLVVGGGIVFGINKFLNRKNTPAQQPQAIPQTQQPISPKSQIVAARPIANTPPPVIIDAPSPSREKAALNEMLAIANAQPRLATQPAPANILQTAAFKAKTYQQKYSL